MKTRVISAIIAILIVIPFIIIGKIPFAIGASFLGIYAYKEMLDLKKSHKEVPNLIKIMGLISLCYLMVGNYEENILFFHTDYKMIILPIILLLLPSVFYTKKDYSITDAIYLLGFIYLIGIPFNLIISIRNINIYLLIYLISITVFTDTFAYLIGSLIGKNKMAPEISPNKSWEGFVAGLIGGSIISLIIYQNLVNSIDIKIIILTICLTIVGQLGDLVFSKIKRENDIKDFSNIMPGHGGVLDRFDSFIFVVLTFVLISLFF